MNHDCNTKGPDFLPLINPPEKDKRSLEYCFAFMGRSLLLICENNSLRLPLTEDLENIDANIIGKQYLGEYGECSCFSFELEHSSFENDSVRFHELRKLTGILDDPIASLAARAVHVMEWDRKTRFCGFCGSKTEQRANERAKECPECGLLFFPKISPAIIVMIEKEDKLLMARSPYFPEGIYGLIAGFVEPGESIEEAVVREVYEEVGISIKDIEYFGSQPWPYPDSLMIRFTAKYSGGEICIDNVEIEDAGWFTMDEMPSVPGTSSISGQLVEYFLQKHRLDK
ncbi:NAD(+) diphosphatase [Methanolobus sp. ZRKC3]|uniref:NAD(+) diphosphatase n=1 Tax=Methanolobus sp. ZRKC3 TaxID=3125786 RepID=UPI003254E928